MSPMPSTATTMKDTMKAARYGIQSQLCRGVDQTLHEAWQRRRPRNIQTGMCSTRSSDAFGVLWRDMAEVFASPGKRSAREACTGEY